MNTKEKTEAIAQYVRQNPSENPDEGDYYMINIKKSEKNNFYDKEHGHFNIWFLNLIRKNEKNNFYDKEHGHFNIWFVNLIRKNEIECYCIGNSENDFLMKPTEEMIDYLYDYITNK